MSQPSLHQTKTLPHLPSEIKVLCSHPLQPHTPHHLRPHLPCRYRAQTGVCTKTLSYKCQLETIYSCYERIQDMEIVCDPFHQLVCSYPHSQALVCEGLGMRLVHSVPSRYLGQGSLLSFSQLLLVVGAAHTLCRGEAWVQAYLDQ